MPKLTDSEMVARVSKQAMEKLNKLPLDEMATTEIAIEQVRATYVLATVLASIQDQIEQIRTNLLNASTGY